MFGPFAADLVMNNTPLIHFTLLLSLVVKLQAVNAWLKDTLVGKDSHRQLLTSISSSVLNDSLDIREMPAIELWIASWKHSPRHMNIIDTIDG